MEYSTKNKEEALSKKYVTHLQTYFNHEITSQLLLIRNEVKIGELAKLKIVQKRLTTSNFQLAT